MPAVNGYLSRQTDANCGNAPFVEFLVCHAVKSFFLRLAFIALPGVGAISNDGAQNATPDPAHDLEEVQNLNLELLRSVTCVVMPEDVKFLYAAALRHSCAVAGWAQETRVSR
jgi:hypothetical protein